MSAVVSMGCGRIGFDPLSAAEDAAGGETADANRGDGNPIDAAGAFDGMVDAPGGPLADAAALGPFGPPTRIPELSDPDADDDDPTLTGDLLEIYFKSDRPPSAGYDIWRATRSSPADPWNAPELVAELSSPGEDETPEVSRDGLSLWLASDRPGGFGRADLWVSTRASRSDSWGTPAHIPELSSMQDDYGAVVDGTGLLVVLGRNVAGDLGNYDILTSSRPTVDSPWSTPTGLVATPGYELDPHTDPSGRVLYYVVEPGGQDRELAVAERPDTASAFGAPVLLTELNTAADDADPWISPDGTLIVFSSDITGDQELYQASR